MDQHKETEKAAADSGQSAGPSIAQRLDRYQAIVAELQTFVEEFKRESDRAAVVIATAKLDYLLSQVLEAFLLPCATGTDELLDGDAPLSTFSARITACVRLGLIDSEFGRALHLVRRIRNDFAHEHQGVTLSTGPHRDRVEALVHRMRHNWALPFLLKQFFDDQPTQGNLFRAAAALLAARLTGFLENTQRIIPPATLELLPELIDPAS